MSSLPRSGQTAVGIIVIILAIPLLYLASIPIFIRTYCSPKLSSGMKSWTLTRSPPSWLKRYNAPLQQAYQNRSIRQILDPPFSAYRDWIYTEGH
jgi:hypothetical protein